MITRRTFWESVELGIAHAMAWTALGLFAGWFLYCIYVVGMLLE